MPNQQCQSIEGIWPCVVLFEYLLAPDRVGIQDLVFIY